ncbi:hypothetical protein [Pseudarthrobacter sulfonivorans]|uniref:hypothetical protein n=1 Tax=Pseudarthrobacter sulfonivorans TaxID=121292 RepID=UPI00286132B8|nr:hypothetical protein [Pseudarthrobacter sulfonivorans]MDR6414938.1 hypothetical protein [Pseudarthrobacter sulfonivorans]
MGNEALSLTMPVDDWLIIDATIDNTVAMASTDGDESVVAQGAEIRKAGWAATRAHPRHQDGWGGWPPKGDELTVALPQDAWRFVVQELHRWEQVASDVGAAAPAADGEPDPGVPESRGLAVARMLAERLGAWAPGRLSV